MKEARKQLKFSKNQNVKIEWHVPSKSKAKEILSILAENNIRGIKLIVTPL